ncbi:TOMM precursor leader peptide-binding protein [Streptomyces sp. NPDC051561]|uniref:TOMM precursor leader peptide-binding protein n=1 Tax=Streptomyces sp. NPDC051561 TaxID=3365658 RepID=UPI00379CA096
MADKAATLDGATTAEGTATADTADTADTARTAESASTADAAREVFDALAGTRPRIRRDVLFTETPGGVLFHNADGGFHLTGRTAYRFASLVVPHLTGLHTLGELCAGFGPAQRAMATELVKTLYDRSFARDIPEADALAQDVTGPEAAVHRTFAAQLAYVDHYADGAAERFGRFRNTAVAVLGGDEVARWCALSLVRNGCARIGVGAAFRDVGEEAAALTEGGGPVQLDQVAADADWAALAEYDVVVVTGAAAGPRTHRLLAAGVPEGRTLIPAWTFGDRAVTGPLATAVSTGCWSCAVLRLGGNVDAGAAAELWSEVAAAAVATEPADGGPLSGPVAAMSGNLLGYEVFRLTTGALPAETEGQVLVQDLRSLDVVAEPVQAHPRCGRCATLTGEDRPGQTVPASPALPETPTVETAREAEALVEDLNRISTALVRPYTGIFSRYDDEELTQTPLKISRVEVALGHGVSRKIAAYDVHHLAGARMRALYAAAETYVEKVVPLTAEALPQGALPLLGPDALTTGAGSTAAVTAWVTATSLLTKEPVGVPAAAVRPFGPYNRDRLHLATTAGAGAGATAQEAAGRGLLSVLGHDALLRAVRGTTSVAPVAPDGNDPELVFLTKSAGNLGIEAELLDLGEEERSSASVVLARETGDGGTGRWAVGAGLTRRAAACAALRDLLGQVQLAAEAGTDDAHNAVDQGLPLVGELAAGTIAVTADAVAADGNTTTLDAVLDRLRTAGRDVLYVATTPADLPAGGISTARILLTRDATTEVTEGGTDARR